MSDTSTLGGEDGEKKKQWNEHGRSRRAMATGELVRKLASAKKKIRDCDLNGNGNADQKSSELAREKMWSRIHLIPVLQAEDDRDLVRRHWAQEAREKELLGAETKVYNNDRCVFASDGAAKETCVYRQLTTETDSCAPRTQSLPARPRNRVRSVCGRVRDRRRKSEEMPCCKYCGYSGAFFHRRQPPADAQYQMFKCIAFRDAISDRPRVHGPMYLAVKVEHILGR